MSQHEKKHILGHVILGERRQSTHRGLTTASLTNASTRSIDENKTLDSLLCALLHSVIQLLESPNQLLADLRVLLLHG